MPVELKRDADERQRCLPAPVAELVEESRVRQHEQDERCGEDAHDGSQSERRRPDGERVHRRHTIEV
jgi:hypothetical protein